MHIDRTPLKALLLGLMGAAATGAVLATAPPAAACDPGWYETDTSGVCTTMPPWMEPAPAPLNPIVQNGNNDIVNGLFETPPDFDGDGIYDVNDTRPRDPDWY